MTDISSISSDELTERRRQLRQKRRLRFLQTSWQILAMTGLTIGVVWVVTLPDWMLRNPSQVAITGDTSLSPDVIRGLLPIRYPQSVLALQPEAIANQLEKQTPIAKATVTRRLFPPGIVIQIEERHPVAAVYASLDSLTPQKNLDSLFAVALLDEAGTWMPYEQYLSFNRSAKLPALKIIGIQEQNHPEWSNLYQSISRSPVKVSLVDWREPGNLILQTELGTVHCGPFGSQFSKQLQVLDQMRKLPDKIAADKIAYIDLTNPDMPMLELVNGTVTPSVSP
jgi:cell division protein FtsQ